MCSYLSPARLNKFSTPLRTNACTRIKVGSTVSDAVRMFAFYTRVPSHIHGTILRAGLLRTAPTQRTYEHS